MGNQVRISDSTISYEVVYRNIKYPRLEFKTGELLLVLPKNYENQSNIIEKHKKWIHRRNAEIVAALEEARKKRLELKRTDKEFKQLIQSFVENISEELKIKINNIYYRKMKSKWGSCSSKKNLTINIILKYLPEDMVEYVIFHEMVHLIERKHNEYFWKIISNKFENYSEKEKSLFEYWFLIQEVNEIKPMR
ncbi:M48 metallopeptidase family protein [Candidatus Methanoperedens nitratireducens]|uniref:YgjP-like metallopeptidase domain-containing protein n=1 Tax=Candidatus Methanoperedens nitratireducens TaxID=1392998 RepID=A0A284VTB9_9EURY|nr:M48 family metallopeptidase [Candidatus Methanoperedens nitroreducens]SNQ62433.1 conserved hypothetical protein [Candidatus Methanoperedens nitroreducens]